MAGFLTSGVVRRTVVGTQATVPETQGIKVNVTGEYTIKCAENGGTAIEEHFVAGLDYSRHVVEITSANATDMILLY